MSIVFFFSFFLIRKPSFVFLYVISKIQIKKFFHFLVSVSIHTYVKTEVRTYIYIYTAPRTVKIKKGIYLYFDL